MKFLSFKKLGNSHRYTQGGLFGSELRFFLPYPPVVNTVRCFAAAVCACESLSDCGGAPPGEGGLYRRGGSVLYVG